MKPAIALIGCALVGALPVSSQTPQFVADGVAVLPVRTRADIPPQNAGWVELEDYLLVIDGGPGDGGSEVLEVARRSTGKPVRFALRTLGGPDDVWGAEPEGLTWLSAVTADVVGCGSIDGRCRPRGGVCRAVRSRATGPVGSHIGGLRASRGTPPRRRSGGQRPCRLRGRYRRPLRR